MRHPDPIETIEDYLSGDMSAEDLAEFEERRDADPELDALTDVLEQLCAMSARRIAGATRESPDDSISAGDAEWERTIALTDAYPPDDSTSPAWPRARPRIRTLVDVAAVLLLGAGWVFYILFPRLPAGMEVELTPGNKVVAERSPVAQLMPNPHIASTGNGQMKTFGLPGRSTILLRPRSEFTYKGDWSPEMTGTLHGEGVLDVPDGTTWTVYGREGSVMLGPGRHALFNDQKDHVLRTRVVIGWAAWGKDTVSAGDGVFIETRSSGGPLKVVEDGSRFPKAWGRDAVDRGERYLPTPTFWDVLRGRPSDEDKGILLAYMARMSAEERAGGAGMPSDITMGEALAEQKAFMRREAEKAAGTEGGQRIP